MEEQVKGLLRELQSKENSRKDALDEINAEMERLDFKEDTDKEKFAGKRDKEGNWLKDGGIYDDINAGLYNNITEGQIQKIIEEELVKINEKYDAQRAALNEKLEESKKQHEEEKVSDYKQINSAIKEYHLDVVLEANKANKVLTEMETEKNNKLKALDEKIAEKEAKQTHLIMRNRKFMGVEATQESLDIRALGQEIEELKATRETIDTEYASKIETQNKNVQYYIQQKEKSAKFLGQIRLSEKSIDEIYQILFGEEKQNQEPDEQVNIENKNQESNVQDNTEITENQEQEGNSTSQELETNSHNDVEVIPAQTSNTITKTINKNTHDNKFSYEFSMKGIKFDGKHININELLDWYKENKEQIENQIKFALGDEEAEEFMQSSDKLIYLSMIFKCSKGPSYGAYLDDKTKEKLKEYYNICQNPKSQEESDMHIKYDLRGMNLIQKLLMRSKLTYRDMQNIRENAFELRNRKNVTIEKGLGTALFFRVKEMIQNAKETKLLNEQNEIENNNEYNEKKVTRFIAKNVQKWKNTLRVNVTNYDNEPSKPNNQQQIQTAEEPKKENQQNESMEGPEI